MFPIRYEDRLLDWHRFRTSCKGLQLTEQLKMINQWWQKVPLVNHYLSTYDYQDWPNPWDILADNNYCQLTKCICIGYTLLLVGGDNHKIAIAQDRNGEHYLIVNDEWILNYDPNSPINTTTSSSPMDLVDIVFSMDCTDTLKQKL